MITVKKKTRTKNYKGNSDEGETNLEVSNRANKTITIYYLLNRKKTNAITVPVLAYAPET